MIEKMIVSNQLRTEAHTKQLEQLCVIVMSLINVSNCECKMKMWNGVILRRFHVHDRNEHVLEQFSVLC